MVLDRDTNTLFISALLKDKHPQFHQKFADKLQNAGITANYLDNTKDIWCRDYMPVQVSENKFVQFRYYPSYLRYKKYEKITTNPSEVWREMGLNVWESKIVLDGGNVVKWSNKAIVTDRVLKDNSTLNEKELYDTIKKELEVEELIIIPELKGDMTGHSDGLVRFVSDDLVLINDISDFNNEYVQKLKYSLLNAGLNYISIPNGYGKQEKYYDDRGDYINFLEMKDLILIPAYGTKKDEEVLEIYSDVFKGKRVENIDCNEIAKEGGVLNCITWNTVLY